MHKRSLCIIAFCICKHQSIDQFTYIIFVAGWNHVWTTHNNNQVGGMCQKLEWVCTMHRIKSWDEFILGDVYAIGTTVTTSSVNKPAQMPNIVPLLLTCTFELPIALCGFEMRMNICKYTKYCSKNVRMLLANKKHSSVYSLQSTPSSVFFHRNQIIHLMSYIWILSTSLPDLEFYFESWLAVASTHPMTASRNVRSEINLFRMKRLKMQLEQSSNFNFFRSQYQ